MLQLPPEIAYPSSTRLATEKPYTFVNFLFIIYQPI
jgi:hypothetical protein